MSYLGEQLHVHVNYSSMKMIDYVSSFMLVGRFDRCEIRAHSICLAFINPNI